MDDLARFLGDLENYCRGSIGSEASIPTKSMKMIFMIGNTSNATVINGLEVEMEEFGGMYIFKK